MGFSNRKGDFAELSGTERGQWTPVQREILKIWRERTDNLAEVLSSLLTLGVTSCVESSVQVSRPQGEEKDK